MIERSPGQTEEGGRVVTLLSYNVHSCVGLDGRPDADRIASIIRKLNPDVVGLQEIANRFGGTEEAAQLEFLAAATGMRDVPGPTLLHAQGDYGNALLTRGEMKSVRRIDLNFRSREPRGALDVELDLDGYPLRVIVTHLGLRPSERRFQVRRLIELFGASPARPLVLMGDMNEWFPWGRPARWLHRYFGRLPLLRTYPTFFPLFALDQILVYPREALLGLEVIVTPETKVASDHLPLLARIALG
jgi:endonuclease/exonuclease/phosphatase family metal-dependent hydrolase